MILPSSAGIVGLGVGREITRRFPRLRLSHRLEKEVRVGAHQSGHNGGVIHSGVYYKPGSLKAKLCVTGAAAMVDFCREHGVPFCGLWEGDCCDFGGAAATIAGSVGTRSGERGCRVADAWSGGTA